MKDVVAILQANDEQQGRDINFLRDRVQEELEAKLTFVLRNKDELLHRIEALERENDRATGDVTIRLDNFNKKLNNEMDSTNEKVDRLISVIARLEEDVRV